MKITRSNIYKLYSHINERFSFILNVTEASWKSNSHLYVSKSDTLTLCTVRRYINLLASWYITDAYFSSFVEMFPNIILVLSSPLDHTVDKLDNDVRPSYVHLKIASFPKTTGFVKIDAFALKINQNLSFLLSYEFLIFKNYFYLNITVHTNTYCSNSSTIQKKIWISNSLS